MANEIRLTQSIVYENGQLKYTYSPGTLQLPQATQGYKVLTVTATSLAQLVSTTEITPGFTIIQNLAPTTTGTGIDWGVTASTTGGITVYTGMADAKESHIFKLKSSSKLYVRNEGAAAGNNKVSITVFSA